MQWRPLSWPRLVRVAPVLLGWLSSWFLVCAGAGYHNGFQLHADLHSLASNQSVREPEPPATREPMSCSNGLLTFELSTGFIYKPSSAETLAMMPSILQLTDCLDYCLQNASCLAINFEMGLCVLLSSSAKQNPSNLYSSQFPVFTIYAEKKCLLQGNNAAARQRHKCQRAWNFERVAGYEMKSGPKRRLRLASRELCMEACLLEKDFECRSANWYRLAQECSLSDQDRHSVSQSEAGDQQLNAAQLQHLYGPSNLTLPLPLQARLPSRPTPPPGLYQNYYVAEQRLRQEEHSAGAAQTAKLAREHANNQLPDHYYVELPASAPVDYLENNCVYEPNKLCEFRKIQNRILKTVDSIYQEVASLDECKQKCLSAPYRCYSFDYGDTAERVCRTSHLDQASLLAVKEPYLEVMGAITYELASCFSVSIQCRAKEMVAQVSSSKSFKGRIYAKNRPLSCVNDVRDSLSFELVMRYHDPGCDVQSSSNRQQGVFSNDIIIQHHDRIVTTQDVGLSVYCQYDLGNRSITSNVDLAIERIEEPSQMESKTQNQQQLANQNQNQYQSLSQPLTITSLATTVVRSPNVTMRITNMNGQPVQSATVGDRLALMFEIKEKTSPFGIFVREIIAMDGKQLLAAANKLSNSANNGNNNGLQPGKRGYHYNSSQPAALSGLLNENTVESLFQANKAGSVQFLDSDGCPTDANIMGPLVKMDQQGHRVLAPFDAFKFPSSDMVFFRAVVTSCVSECKPAQCQGLSSPLPSPAQPAFYSTTEADNQLARTTTPVDLTHSSEARPLPSASPTPVTPSSAAYPASPTGVPTGTSTTTASSLMGPKLWLSVQPNRSQLESAANQTRWSESASNSTSGGTRTSGDVLTTTPGLGPSSSSMAQHPTGGPSSVSPSLLSSLDAQQRQQLLKLLEHKLKQQLALAAASGSAANRSITELYANLLASVVLGDASQPEVVTARSLISPESSLETETEVDGATVAALLLADLESLAANSNQSIGNQGDFSQLFERSRELPRAMRPPTMSSSTGSNESARSQPEPTGSNNNKQQQSPNKPAKSQQQRAEERKRLQALADSYLGALQVSSERRHKRQVDEDLAAAELGWSAQMVEDQLAPLAPSVLKRSSLPPGTKFTQSTAHLYHRQRQQVLAEQQSRTKREAQPHYDMDELVVQAIKITDRLEFSDEQIAEQQRLKQQQKQRPAKNKHSLPRSSLVTSVANRTSNENALAQTDEQVEPDWATAWLPDSWTGASLLGLLILIASFLFVQLFIALACLLQWSQRRAMAALANKRRQQQLYQQQVSAGMTSLSRCISASSLSSQASQAAQSPASAASLIMAFPVAQSQQPHVYPSCLAQHASTSACQSLTCKRWKNQSS